VSRHVGAAIGGVDLSRPVAKKVFAKSTALLLARGDAGLISSN
jgi:hypothetical protein